MAWLRTLSDRVVITRSGFTFTFKANVPRDIPEANVQACLDVGCLKAEEAPVVLEQQDNTELDEALRTIIADGSPENFKADKTPKHLVVNSLLTNKKSAREIADRFTEIMSGGDI